MSGHTVRAQRPDDGPAGINDMPAPRPGLRVVIIVPREEQTPEGIERILADVQKTIDDYIEARKR